MITSGRFNSSENLIYASAEVYGPGGSVLAKLALDTGATITILSSNVILGAGYDLATGNEVRIVTGSAVPTARELVITRLDAIGQSVKDLYVVCHDLPDESGLDGLLGLNFLRKFDTVLL